jgi:endonuclease/exonuclease/phosphatase family metal-dependent hydrolase
MARLSGRIVPASFNFHVYDFPLLPVIAAISIILVNRNEEQPFETIYMEPIKSRMKLKSRVFFLLLIACTGGAFAQSTAGSSRIVRVLTFNILHGATLRGDFNLDVIAAVIKEADPDFVALQEVDYMTARDRKLDLATELGQRTRLVSLFGRAMPYDGGEYGVGVLSRYTLLASRNTGLPFTPGNEPRTALEITTVLGSGDTVNFIATHLDQVRDDRDRVAQVRKINERVAGSRYPAILAGDLNAQPGSAPINILGELWGNSDHPERILPTFPSDHPVKKIDYVMFYPKNKWKVLETRVIQDTVASDHCAYLAVLELVEKK